MTAIPRTIHSVGTYRMARGSSIRSLANADSVYTEDNVLRALCHWYAANGDDDALQLVHCVAQPLLAPRLWAHGPTTGWWPAAITGTGPGTSAPQQW